MNRQLLKYFDITNVGQLVTAVNTPATPSSYALETYGLLPKTQNRIAERDWGTKHLYGTTTAAGGYPASLALYDAFNMFDSKTNRTYDIGVFVDNASPKNLSLWVNDSNLVANAWNTRGLSNGWIDLAKIETTTVDTAGVGGSMNAVINLTTTQTNELAYYLCLNTTRTPNQLVFIKSSSVDTTKTTISLENYVTDLGWQAGDALTLYRHNGIYRNLPTAASKQLGNNPFIRWSDIEAQQKVNLYYGSATLADDSPTMKVPLQFRRINVTRNFFYATTPFQTLPAGWYVEQGGGGLIPNCTVVGSEASPKDESYNTASTIGDGLTGLPWLSIGIGSSITTDGKPYSKWVVTALYADGSESDPIYKIFLKSSDTTKQMVSSFAFSVNFAAMNKEIIGLNFYGAAKSTEELPGGMTTWNESSNDYSLVYTASFDTQNYALGSTTVANDFILSTGQVCAYTLSAFAAGSTEIDAAKAAGNGILGGVTGNLQHAVDLTRAYLTPRFGVYTTRNQNGIMVIDEDDQYLRISSINGSGVAENNNFPNASTDSEGNRLRIGLESRGEMLGLHVVNGEIVVRKRTELEVIDLTSGISRVLPVDSVARKGAVNTPIGLFVGSRSGIVLVQSDGGGYRTFNSFFSNLYDGTLQTEESTPKSRVSDANRTAMLMGYDPAYRRVLVYLPTYNSDNSGTLKNTTYICYLDSGEWYARIFNLTGDGTLRFFQSRKDNSFSVCYGNFVTGTAYSGILEYPNIGSYEDDLCGDGTTSQQKGIPTKLVINVPDVYSLTMGARLEELILDTIGEMSTGLGSYNIKFYANKEISAFESKSQDYTIKPSPRKIPPIGAIQSLRMEFSLTEDANLYKFKKWLFSRLSLGYSDQLRTGNA